MKYDKNMVYDLTWLEMIYLKKTAANINQPFVVRNCHQKQLKSKNPYAIGRKFICNMTYESLNYELKSNQLVENMVF